jgi:hypothetical protein
VWPLVHVPRSGAAPFITSATVCGKVNTLCFIPNSKKWNVSLQFALHAYTRFMGILVQFMRGL